jgi:hypothetical protein
MAALCSAVAEAHGWLISRVTLSFWCRIESRAKSDIRLNLGPVVGTTVPWPELAIGFAERLKAALEPLPSVIPTINLRTLNVTVMMGELPAQPRQPHARVWLQRGTMIFFAHLGCGMLPPAIAP